MFVKINENCIKEDVMSTFDKVKEMLVEKLGVEPSKVTLESEIIKDLGADSLDLVEMLFSMDEVFGVTVSDEQTESIKTVKDIVDIIDSAK
jgi:acyl carrier protein